MSTNPASGEWTVERIRAFLYDDHGYKIGGGEEGLASAINSNELATEAREAMEMWRESEKQLASEQQRTEEFARAQAKANARLCEIESEHQKQLADEKESCHKLSKTLHAAIAAEKDAVTKVWEALGISTYDQAKPLTVWEHVAQLREKLQRLEDALKLVRKALCSGGGLREATDIIDDALAKVGAK